MVVGGAIMAGVGFASDVYTKKKITVDSVTDRYAMGALIGGTTSIGVIPIGGLSGAGLIAGLISNGFVTYASTSITYLFKFLGDLFDGKDIKRVGVDLTNDLLDTLAIFIAGGTKISDIIISIWRSIRDDKQNGCIR